MTHDVGPVLETQRLVLRPPVPADYEGYRAYFASDRSRFTGGPLDERNAWRGFAALLGHWQIRGFGMWTVTGRGSDAPLGHVGCWFPGDWPEQELGWIVYEAAEGRGIAFEAASAAKAHAFGQLGWPTAVSYIAPQNARSIALAERLGAVRDDEAARPGHAPDVLVYRHAAPDNDGSPEAYA